MPAHLTPLPLGTPLQGYGPTTGTLPGGGHSPAVPWQPGWGTSMSPLPMPVLSMGGLVGTSVVLTLHCFRHAYEVHACAVWDGHRLPQPLQPAGEQRLQDPDPQPDLCW